MTLLGWPSLACRIQGMPVLLKSVTIQIVFVRHIGPAHQAPLMAEIS